MTGMNYFEMCDNDFTGTIPASYSAWTKLTAFWVEGNSFSGALPALPWHQMPFGYPVTGCYLQPGNAFSCPLPLGAVEYCRAYNPRGFRNISAADCFPPNNCTGSSVKLAPAQCDAWITMFDELGGASWKHCSNTRHDPCSCNSADDENQIFAIVECDGTGNMTKLELFNNSLGPTVPSVVAALSNLKYLNFGGNDLSGTIPESVFSLTNIESLRFQLNSMSGSIPPSIVKLTALQELLLDYNRFSGNIPSSIAELGALHTLLLEQNLLGGPVPAINFSRIVECDITGNHFTCPLPPGAAGCNTEAKTTVGCIPNRCTGTSVNLEPRQCDSWILLFDAMGGSSWDFCNSTRTDPCSCMNYDAQTPVCNRENTSVLRV
jgi:hypothetical protein